jgi:hypothetical protein
MATIPPETLGALAWRVLPNSRLLTVIVLTGDRARLTFGYLNRWDYEDNW